MDAATKTQPLADKGALPAESASHAQFPGGEPLSADLVRTPVVKATPVQIGLMVLGTIAFLYFARPVILPLILACMAGMALKPLIRWLSYGHIPPTISAAFVICVLVSAISIGFFQLGRPAMAWMNQAPQHLNDLRQRTQNLFPGITRFNRAAAAVHDLGVADEEQKGTMVEVKTSRVPATLINWTGTLLVGIGETLVLLYLLLASGDLFLQKLVRVLPTLHDKKRGVEISHEIQQIIANYLLSV